MAGMASLFAEAGAIVRGSDGAPPYPPTGPLLSQLHIPVMHPYSPDNLSWRPDLVVVGNVIRATNPEAQALLERGIPYLSMPEALRRFFLQGRRSLVVAGTHGKTTTASLLAHLLAASGHDPGFLIGGIPLNFQINARLGSGPFFVVEGDEYDTAFFDKSPKFLHYEPKAAILNPVEFDHADIFRDLDHVISAFSAFCRLLPDGAPLIVPHGDDYAASASSTSKARVITSGLERGTWQARDIEPRTPGFAFTLYHNDTPKGRFFLPLIGRHNLKNTTSVLALLHELNLAHDDLPLALSSFKGVCKRQELRGIARGVMVFDDFAHHPTAVRETLCAFREAYPKARLIALFEPESNTSRRKVFQHDFARAFLVADRVLFCRPLEKPDGLRPEEKLDMALLCHEIREGGVPADMIEDIRLLASKAAMEARPGDVIVAMSGRDFYGIHDLILEELTRG